MDYTQAVAYLYDAAREKRKNTFGVLTDVLEQLGSPQERLNIIHIAGTNGKGSACALISSVLQSAGYKTGVYTSPHMERFNERITVNGAPIPDADFAGTLLRAVQTAGDIKLSFFEILTLMAYIYFFEQGVDYAITETGIGGLMDATNIIKKPVLSVITRIGLDHTALLGGTINSIAAQKAGIIKKNRPAVLYFNDGKVYNTVRRVCAELDAPLYESRPKTEIISQSLTGSTFSAHSEYFCYNNIRISLPGSYQIGNAADTLTAVRALQDSGAKITEHDIRAGYAGARWPCRMEVISQNPLIIIDGAHNPQGAEAFVKSVSALNINRRIILVAGVQTSKPADTVLSILSQCSETVIITRASYGSYVREACINKAYTYIDDCRTALDTALDAAGADCCVCVAGSLYLAGEARAYLKSVLPQCGGETANS